MKKKVLFVINVDWFFISHRLPIALKAIENGYEVHLACNFTGQEKYLQSLGIKLHFVDFSRSSFNPISEFKVLLSIKKILTTVKPDIMHSITIKPVIYSGLLIKTMSRKPAFIAAISGLGFVFSSNSLRTKLTRFLVTLLYKFSLSHSKRMVIFQNSSDEEFLTNIANLQSSEKVLIPGSGVDLKTYQIHVEPMLSKTIIVMASRLLKEKGVYEYVNVARSVLNKRADVEFLLVGAPDPDNPNSITNKELKEWDVSGIVKVLGHRNDINKIFSESNIVTLPSFYGEGVPKVLIEAAACGRAVITTDNPGCRDAILPNETGILVPVCDQKELEEAILRLVDDVELRRKMGLKARELAEEKFDVTSVVNKHLGLYSMMADTE